MNIKELEQVKGFCSLKGTSKEVIQECERTLKLTFSNEYREYLEQYSLASVYGHELTGIVESKRLNVVDVTLKNKIANTNAPNNFYVIEELNIDDVVVWQDEKGAVYQSIGTSIPCKIFDSLLEYIKS